ncbi:MAG: murein biosynthesis integral membrane protein MurJ [Oscillospiraceae bacterium]|nr:murein biosynthesis integral membrane protein MurJ [Oscillospiraceae bacterium]MBQ9108841.1 murein biosynthesis integral membrane protein MurJ [Oscillospiraceae bacterium]
MQKAAKYTIIMMATTVLAKLLGFVREMVLAYRFGAGAVSDAYVICFSIPTVILAGLGTAIMTCYISIYSELEVNNPRRLQQFHNSTTSLILLISVALVGIFQAFSEPIVKLFAVGFDEATLQFAVSLARIMVISLLFIALSYMLQGYLQMKGSFVAVGLVSVPLNIMVILTILLAKDNSTLILGTGPVIGYAVAVGMLLGVALKKGYTYFPQFRLRDPYIKKLLKLVLPIFAGRTIIQINALIDRSLGSTLVEGSVSALNYANRVFGVVTSVFVVSLITAVFPQLSRQNAQHNMRSIKRTTRTGMGMVTLIVLPMSAALIFFAEPIIRILFERGAFGADAVRLTAESLTFYSIGLIFYSYRDVLSNVFYSMQDTKIPTFNSILAVLLNIGLNYALIGPLAHKGLALATSLSSVITVIMLMISLRRKIGPMGWRSLLVSGVKMLVGTAVMIAAAKGAYWGVETLLETTEPLLPMVAAAGVGVVVYVVVLLLLGTREMAQVIVGAYQTITRRKSA